MVDEFETIGDYWDQLPTKNIPAIAARTALRMLPNIAYGNLVQFAESGKMEKAHSVSMLRVLYWARAKIKG